MTAGIQIEFDEVEANFTIVPNQVIYNRELSSDARFLWLYLRSHKVGYALGYRQMSLELGWSEVTVRKHLNALNAAGLVDVQATREGSRNGKLGIRLLLNPQPIKSEGSKSEGSKSMGLNKTIKTNKTTKETTLAQDRLEPAFSEFWKAYPRKVGKVAAKIAFTKAWRALEASGEPTDILTGVALFAKDPNKPSKEFLPHPSTWLNEGRWDDEPYPEREKTKEELEAIRAEQVARRREIDKREQEQRREQARLEAERLAANPVTRCEHDRVKVICPICSKDVPGSN